MTPTDHQIFIHEFVKNTVEKWNEIQQQNSPTFKPLGLHSNVALFARCIAEAIWINSIKRKE